MAGTGTMRGGIGSRIKERARVDSRIWGQRETAVGSITGAAPITGSTPAAPTTGEYLPLAGGSLHGRLAFQRRSMTVSNGRVNVGNGENGTSYMIVAGGREINPDLEFLDGAKNGGQILILRITARLTVKHGRTIREDGTSSQTGNIRLIGGEDLVVDPNESGEQTLILIFDGVTQFWIQLVPSRGGSGGDFLPLRGGSLSGRLALMPRDYQVTGSRTIDIRNTNDGENDGTSNIRLSTNLSNATLATIASPVNDGQIIIIRNTESARTITIRNKVSSSDNIRTRSGSDERLGPNQSALFIWSSGSDNTWHQVTPISGSGEVDFENIDSDIAPLRENNVSIHDVGQSDKRWRYVYAEGLRVDRPPGRGFGLSATGNSSLENVRPFPSSVSNFRDLGVDFNEWNAIYGKDFEASGVIRAKSNNAVDIGSFTRRFRTVYAKSTSTDGTHPNIKDRFDLGTIRTRWDEIWVNKVFVAGDIRPNSNRTHDIGTSTAAFDKVYADELLPPAGNLATTGSIGSSTRVWSTAAIHNIRAGFIGGYSRSVNNGEIQFLSRVGILSPSLGLRFQSTTSTPSNISRPTGSIQVYVGSATSPRLVRIPYYT